MTEARPSTSELIASKIRVPLAREEIAEQAVEAVKAAGVETKIVIGGAPVSPEFAAEVEADGFAADAGAAAGVALGLVGAAGTKEVMSA